MALFSYISLRRLSRFLNKAKQYIADKIGDATFPDSAKEVLSVLSYSSIAPDNPADGDMYINSSSNKLYTYSTDQETWAETEASSDVIYIAEDTFHAYVYSNGVFNDITGTQVDDVIYISSMSDLDSYTTKGMYKIYAPFNIMGSPFSGNSGYGSFTKNYYTFIVNAQFFMRTQIVHNNTGYATRSKSGSSAWGAWRAVEYASTEYVKDVYDIACAGLIL